MVGPVPLMVPRVETNDDAGLVRLAQQGDERAWRQLVQRWLPVVHGWCARLGGSRVDPNDAAQDVLELVWLRLASLEDPAAFPRWVWTITRRVLYRHRRRAWLRRWLPGPLPSRGDPRAGPELRVARSQVARQVQALLERLPTAQSEVLVLCDVEGRSSREALARMVAALEVEQP